MTGVMILVRCCEVFFHGRPFSHYRILKLIKILLQRGLKGWNKHKNKKTIPKVVWTLRNGPDMKKVLKSISQNLILQSPVRVCL